MNWTWSTESVNMYFPRGLIRTSMTIVDSSIRDSKNIVESSPVKVSWWIHPWLAFALILYLFIQSHRFYSFFILNLIMTFDLLLLSRWSKTCLGNKVCIVEWSWLTSAGITIKYDLFIGFLVKVNRAIHRLLRKIALSMCSLCLGMNVFGKHIFILIIKYFLWDSYRYFGSFKGLSLFKAINLWIKGRMRL